MMVTRAGSINYVDSSNLSSGPVLVVGGGNSGAQIALELSNDREDVTLSMSHRPKFLPLQVFGKSIFYWLEKLQLLYAGTNTMRGRRFQKSNDPIFGLELKRAIKEQHLQIKPRVTKVVGEQVTFSDGSTLKTNNIIWATGFIPAYEMIEIAGAIDEKGWPIHERVVSPINGLFYIGLPWQYSRGSGLVCGVGKDAKYLAGKIF